MRVTIAICTWNRPASLDRTLATLSALAVPPGIDWELLVVYPEDDKARATEEVLSRHCDRLPLRPVRAAQRGISRQRNAAVTAAQGELLLWTDDDVLVEPDWLREYVAASVRWPDAAIFGGTVIPWFETPPPAWVTANWPRLSHVYAAREFTGPDAEVDSEHLPYGANFAVRTEVQRRYLYNPNLGHIGDRLVQGEETAVILRMRSDGHRGRIIPAARVRHFIPNQRLTLGYARRWFFALGQAHEINDAATAPALGAARKVLVKTWFALNACYSEAAYGIRRLTAPPEQRIWPATQASYFWGRLARRVPRDAR